MMHRRNWLGILPLVLFLGIFSGWDAQALTFEAKDMDIALDAGYLLCDGTWVAASNESALILIGSTKDNAMKVAIAEKNETGAYRIAAQSNKIISYSDYCRGAVQMFDTWDDGRPYFWYESRTNKDVYLCVQKDAESIWKVTCGSEIYHGEYEDDVTFSFFAAENPEEMCVYKTLFPQISWPVDEGLALERFDMNAIEKECAKALQYLDDFQKTHSYGDQDMTYGIIWE